MIRFVYLPARRRQSSFAPTAWESGDYEFERGGMPFKPPPMFKARSEPAAAIEGLEEATGHRVKFDSNPRVFRSR